MLSKYHPNLPIYNDSRKGLPFQSTPPAASLPRRWIDRAILYKTANRAILRQSNSRGACIWFEFQIPPVFCVFIAAFRRIYLRWRPSDEWQAMGSSRRSHFIDRRSNDNDIDNPLQSCAWDAWADSYYSARPRSVDPKTSQIWNYVSNFRGTKGVADWTRPFPEDNLCWRKSSMASMLVKSRLPQHFSQMVRLNWTLLTQVQQSKSSWYLVYGMHMTKDFISRYMPPVTTISGIPTIGVVFSRLIVDGKFHGIRPVVVSLTDGKGMCKGVSSRWVEHICVDSNPHAQVSALRMVPPRSGSKPLDHSMTSFDHVRLPPGSVIGSLEESTDVRGDFLKSIWRISTGGLALSLGTVSFLSVGVYIAGKYSLRRTVSGPEKGSKMPIIGFRTQQLPILHGLAQVHVLQAFSKFAIPLFRDRNLHMYVRHGISTIFKATALQHCQSTLLALEERCGAQGLFNYNQIVRGHVRISPRQVPAREANRQL